MFFFRNILYYINSSQPRFSMSAQQNDRPPTAKEMVENFQPKRKEAYRWGCKKEITTERKGFRRPSQPPPNPNFLGLKTVPPNQILKEIIRFRYRVSHETRQLINRYECRLPYTVLNIKGFL